MEYRLLSAFRGLFEGTKYEHRKSTLGDYVASFLYEDLVSLGRSPKLLGRVRRGMVVVNAANVAVGKRARRGDGTFGEVVPGLPVTALKGFAVGRGRISSVEIGTEVKILAKAMNKQIDRVINDLKTQVSHFRTSNPRAICVGIVGINHAQSYVSFEGSTAFQTDGKRYKHPIQEAAQAADKLTRYALPAFDEFILLGFSATNVAPYPFNWENEAETKAEYGAALARISREYENRF